MIQYGEIYIIKSSIVAPSYTTDVPHSTIKHVNIKYIPTYTSSSFIEHVLFFFSFCAMFINSNQYRVNRVI